MIVGIGTDIVAVQRLSAMWDRHGERLIPRMLAESEYPSFSSAVDKGRFLAKRFAAKEAFSKALGTGVRPPAILSNIAIAHDDLGKPTLKFHGQLEILIKSKNLRVHLSISDESDYAIAYVVLEQA